MKKTTKNLLISQLSILTASSIIAPAIALSIRENKKYQYVEADNNSTNTYDSSKLIFDNRIFNTKQELMAYANDTLIQESINTNTPTSYLIKNDPKYSEVFGNVGINNFLDEKIKKYDIKISKELETDMIGSVLNNDLKFIHDPNNSNEVMIYRGRNNSVHTSEEEAKESYIEVHEIYRYKDIYFPTKQSLGNYLQQNTDQWYGIGEPSGFVLVAPNGQESNVIEVNKINEESTKQYIKNFVKVHCDENMGYLQNNGGTTAMVYYNDENYSESDFSINYDSNYVYVSSNGGKGKYVIDTVASDEAQLNGPYYVTSSSSMEDVTNKSFWGETQNTDIEKTDRYKNLQIVSNFFDSIITSEVSESADVANKFFNIDDSEYADDVEKFFKSIKDNFPSLYSKLETKYNDLKKGERYSTFYKIPLFYLMIIDGLVNKGAKQYFIDNAIETFEKICDYCDIKLQSTISNRLLLKRNENGTRSSQIFSFKDFFQIGNKMLDLNYDIQADVTKMLNEYPDILKAAKAYPAMTGIKSKIGSTYRMPFNREFFNRNFDLNIDENEQFWYEIMWNSICTDDFMQLSNAATLISITNDDCSDYNPSNTKGISPIYNSYFFDEWSRTIIMNEAIRYALTQEKWIYSDKQEEFLDSLGFMKLNDTVERTTYNSFAIQKQNLNYMKELYEKNDKNIENIFYIIMSMVNQQGQKCRDLFGDPKSYDDEIYSEKIYDYFYNNILNNLDTFDKLVSEVFSIDIMSLTTFASEYDFGVEIDKSSDQNQDNELISYIQTISKYPSVNKSDNINLSKEPKKEIISGRPKILFIPEKSRESNVENKKSQLRIPDPNKYGNIYNRVKTKENKRDLGDVVKNLSNVLDKYNDSIIGYYDFYKNRTKFFYEQWKQWTNELATVDRGSPRYDLIKKNIDFNETQYLDALDKFMIYDEKKNFEMQFNNKIKDSLIDIDNQLKQNKKDMEELQKKLDDLNNDLANDDKSLRDKLEAEYAAEMEKVNNKIKDLEDDYKSKLNELDDNVRRELNDLDERIDREVDKINNDYKRKQDELWDSYGDEINKINQQQKKDLDEIQSQINKLDKDRDKDLIDQLNKQKQKVIEDAQKKSIDLGDNYNKEKSNIEKEKQKKINDTVDKRRKGIDDISKNKKEISDGYKKQYDKDKKNAFDDRDNIKKRAGKDYDDRINQTRKEFNSKYDSLNNDIHEMKRKNPLRTKWKEGFAKFMEVFQIIGSALSYLEMAFMVFDIIVNFKKTVKVSYSYVSNDFNLVWDGGYRTSWFYGLIPGDSKGLEAIEIMNPIEIVRPNKITGYYYNGYTYSTPEEVKRVQMKDVLKGTYKNKNITTYYSFEKMTKTGSGNKYYSDSVDKLCDMVYEDAKDYCDKLNANNSKTNPPTNNNGTKVEPPKFIIPNSYSFYDNNKIYEIDTINKTPQDNIDTILANIQPCLIAYYPILNDDGTNYPVTKDQFEKDDESVPGYEIPGKYFDMSTGTIKTNNVNGSLYETYDMNKKEKTEFGIDIKTARERLYETMSQKFNVYSKNVFEDDIINVKHFSDFNNFTDPSQLYIAYGAYGQKKYFTNKTAAVNYIFSSYDIEIFYDRSVKNVFIYNNELFESKQDYFNWILNNTKGF